MKMRSAKWNKEYVEDSMDGPHNLHRIEARYHTIESIIVTERNNKVNSITFKIDASDTARYEQYWFGDGEPGGCIVGGVCYSEWPSDRPPLPNKFRLALEELGDNEIVLKESLKRCIGYFKWEFRKQK